MSFIVHDPGLYSLIVDAGRPRTRSLGVSLGGAADRAAFQLGNAILGNESHAPALELTLTGPTLEATDDVGAVIFGAPFAIHRNGEKIIAGHPFQLRRGDRLRIGGTSEGARGYLCVTGGFRSPLILQSRSALEPIQRDAILQCEPGIAPTRYLPFVMSNEMIPRRVISILPGPQAEWFADGVLNNQKFQVTPASNRMGVRLQSEPLQREPRELISEPVAPGTIQVTNDGQCIILGVDGQTIGGYPKIAQVIRADLDAIAQLRPRDEVVFEYVSMAEAEALGERYSRTLREWLFRLSVAEWR